MLRLAPGCLFAVIAMFAVAHQLESTHLFGFTLGSDVSVGEKQAESEAAGRFGKALFDREDPLIRPMLLRFVR
jgi:hypothetical protein